LPCYPNRAAAGGPIRLAHSLLALQQEETIMAEVGSVGRVASTTHLVAEAMHWGAETVRPEDTVQLAAVVMEAFEIGPLPVCDGDRLVGMITDRDITIRAVAAGRDPSKTTVREIMTADDVVSCRDDQDVSDAVALMRTYEVRRLPVVDRHDRVIGMIALADIARSESPEIAAAALAGVSQPTQIERLVR
jgi:CBS domain-containing protein